MSNFFKISCNARQFQFASYIITTVGEVGET